MRRWIGFFMAISAALLAAALPATAAFAEPAGAPLSIVSVGAPVQTKYELSLGNVAVRNNGAAPVYVVNLRFELVPVGGAALPIAWTKIFHLDKCNLPVSGVPTPALNCEYVVEVGAGKTVDIPVLLYVDPTSASTTAPAPKVKVTVGDPSTGDSVTTAPVDRHKVAVDLALTVDGPLTGRVGDIVDVRWRVVNNGPDAVGAYSMEFAAPGGTEWTGAAASSCDPVPRVVYRCVGTGPSSGTWQLRIVSADVTPGSIHVFFDWTGGKPADPYFDWVDPDDTNNTVALTIKIDTSPRPSASASPSASPVAEPLPATGSDSMPYAFVGAGALIAGIVLLVVARRRRRPQFIVD